MAKQSPPTPQRASGTPARKVAVPRADGARKVQAPSIATFIQESRAELRKVTWPTRQETLNLTGAVLAMTIGVAVFLGIVDEILNYLIKPIIGG